MQRNIPAMEPDLSSSESGGSGGEEPSMSEECSPPESSDLVKITLLGAPAVGKTSIVQQFVWNDFCEVYYPTDRRHSYYPSVIINGRLYETKISDLPPVPYFPVDSLLEWADCPSYALRSATAYVLVFDLSNAADTFRHIKCLREQMAGSRDMRDVPVVVVGNKHDRLHERVNTAIDHPPGSFFGVPCLSSDTPSSLTADDDPTDEENYGPRGTNSALYQQRQKLRLQDEQNALALAQTRERRRIANLVREHWRCSYVECSAKYNWKVVSIFKELMQAVDAIDERRSPFNGSDFSEKSERVLTGLDIANGEATVHEVHLKRHRRTPIVVDEFPGVLSRSRCEVL